MHTLTHKHKIVTNIEHTYLTRKTHKMAVQAIR